MRPRFASPLDPCAAGEVDCGLAGTVMRFLPPLAAMADGIVHFDGDEQARTRPLGTILEALRGLGRSDRGWTHSPFTVTGTGSLRGRDGHHRRIRFVAVRPPVSCSRAAAFEEGVTVHHDGKPVPSMPHIDMTVEMLREAGVSVTTPATGGDADTWRVAPGPVRAVDWAIEPDLSNATPFLAAAASDRRNRQRPVVAVVDDATRATRSAGSSPRWGPTSLSPMVS